NIVLHALSAIMLWRVLLRLKISGAWLAAALFVVHPVCVASVDWIAERKNVLSLFFYFAALLLYLRFELEQRKRFYWSALGLFLLALLSKSSVVVLPMVLLLCVWWLRQKLTWQNIRHSVPFFGLAFVMGLVTVWFQLHEVLLGEAKETDTILTRVLGGSWALWFYLGKILWPLKLSMIYPQWDIDETKWISYLPAALWLSLLVVFWSYRRTWGRPFLFAFGYFTAALLPVLGFFDMNFLLFSQVADHLQYIAIPGIIVLAVGLSAELFRRVSQARAKTSSFPRYFPRITGAIVVLILAILTFRQSSTYQDEETLWRDTIQKNPTAWVGYNNLADRLAELHRFDEAANYYRQALRLKPNHAQTHNNLGNILHLLGRFDEAIDQFLDAIQTKPELAQAHHNLGIAYYRKKEYAKALDCYKKAIQLKPNYGQAHFSAGNCELRLDHLDAALNHYFTAERYIPNNPDVPYNIGIILSVRGQTNHAVRFLQTALRLDPRHKEAQAELQLLLANTDRR
ncbi:MAG: Tetratricopeptide 2 repeat protein, partial [Verrucomicrobiales bacterium]|nr:Tetratricopeptide 2 repeat protein [Verrucomicrobiales bacterium]